MMKPNFLIIGTSRAGTTSMWSYLGQHPEVFMCPVKEPGFFIYEGKDKILTPKGWRLLRPYEKSWIAYCDLFSEAKNEKIIGEATTGYIYYPWVPNKIHRYLPNVKMLAILRNPIDRAYSLYLLHVQRGQETAKTFEEALELEDERYAKGYFFGHYKRRGLYYEQLRRYFKIFSKNQIMIVLYDDLKNNLDGLLHDIHQFLEVDPSFKPDTSQELNARGEQPTIVHKTWTTMGKLSRVGLFNILIPNHLRRKLSKKFFQWRRIKVKTQPKPPMNPETRRKLLDYFREDILKLSDLINRDLSHWLKEETKTE